MVSISIGSSKSSSSSSSSSSSTIPKGPQSKAPPVAPTTNKNPFSAGPTSSSASNPTPVGHKIPSGSGRGGGSSGGNMTPANSTPAYFTPNAQTISNAEQIQARTLAQQNVNTQRDAAQNDTNYFIKTSNIKPTSTYYSSNPNFVGREDGSITIYTDKSGRTTGGASFGGQTITGLPEGLNVGRNAITSTGERVLVSNFLAENISIKTSEQQFLTPQNNNVLDLGPQQSSSNYPTLPGTAISTTGKQMSVAPELSTFGKLNQKFASFTTKPVYSFLESKGISLTSLDYQKERAVQTAFVAGPFGIGSGALALSSPKYRDLIAGANVGINTQIKEKPLYVVGTAAIGGVGGLAFKGLSIGASLISPAVSSGINIGGTLAGIGLTGVYAYKTGTQVYNEKDYAMKGNILGKAALETSAFGFGFTKGVKGAEQLSGFLSTMGRDYIPLEKLTQPEIISGKLSFPEIPKSQQLGAFRTGKYKEFVQPAELTGGKQGGFHTTPTKFSQKISPTEGTSELPGLYISPFISPHFAKISGSGSSSGFNILNSLKSLASPSGLPGVAFIKTEGFRYSPYGITGKATFENQKSIGGKFAFFKKRVETGVGDVPLMKVEAEAILRPGSGDYLFESGKYYTKINEVRVPIDVFSYSGKGGKNVLGKINVETASSKRGGYNLPSQTKYYPLGIKSNVFSDISSSSKLSSSSSLGYSNLSGQSSIKSSKSYFSSISQVPRSQVPSSSSYYKSNIPPYSPPYGSSTYPSYDPPSYPPYSPPTSLSLGGYAQPKGRGLGRGTGFNIAPSFTGIVQNKVITAPLKVSSTYGVTPFQTRGLFVGKRSKKERYYQLTDL